LTTVLERSHPTNMSECAENAAIFAERQTLADG
jgi:hypothetical protein